jgi:uncharacterized protein YdhG (YjbR/CyaY superfamily)
MRSEATTVEEYLAELPEDRRAAVSAVRDVVNANLPEGYEETMEWGMVTWVVPLREYPDTYNGRPLSYISLASQKNHLALYLMGLNSESPHEQWFRDQYAERGLKLDLGKSCLRFRTLDEVPLDVIGEVVARVPVAEFVALYESSRGGR